jgi:chemotaxis protein histidine kinase CheA
LADYVVTVHGIKGSSRGIGAERVGAMAEDLENAARRGDLDFVSARNQDFLEAAFKLVSDLEDMFTRIGANNSKPKKDRPDSELLSKLIAACESYDMDGVDAGMDELEAFDYEEDEGLAVWLRKNADRMNFSEIKEKLSAIL